MTQCVSVQKIITVSGLYSGIGKTTLSECIVAIVPAIAAIKITINDYITEISENDSSIMVEGKDTWRLKTSGAGKVIWIQSTEANLHNALPDALDRAAGFASVLIEGNSVLRYIKPDIGIFLCDERILDARALKPSRLEALKKADVVINNMRINSIKTEFEVEKKIRGINKTAPVIPLSLSSKIETSAYINQLLSNSGFIT
jgi:molybdopterin-guanine dinucleotide biosynthesis protein